MLLERGLAESRNKAQALLLARQVEVSIAGQKVPTERLKPGGLFSDQVEIKVLQAERFVSRGGEKLAAALEHWYISAQDKIVLDVGASTGGFCDCLLQNGARFIYALDVGHGQLHPKIRADKRVQVFEKTHILKWTPTWEKRSEPNLVVMDVSFISAIPVVKKLREILPLPSSLLVLFKPQFEVGPENLKKGIVKNPTAREAACQAMEKTARELGYTTQRFSCPIAGAEGNVEEWFYLSK